MFSFFEKKKRNLFERLRSSLLGYPDSNQERQDQNLQCYHYTISQFPLQPKYCLIASAKVRRKYEISKYFSNFFQFKPYFFVFYDKTQVLSAEYREIYTAVCPMLHESGMSGEIIILAMFEDENAFGSKDVLLEDEVGNLRKFLECVGRVGKDKVKLLAA